jgi:hypothetical protein
MSFHINPDPNPDLYLNFDPNPDLYPDLNFYPNLDPNPNLVLDLPDAWLGINIPVELEDHRMHDLEESMFPIPVDNSAPERRRRRRKAFSPRRRNEVAKMRRFGTCKRCQGRKIPV